MARVRSYVHARMANPADADDILQESLARTIRRAGEVDIARPDFYALSIARNLMADHARQQAGTILCEIADSLPCEAPLPDQRLNDRERMAIFSATLAAMPPLRRDIFIRRRIEGQSREAIAQALDMQVEAVKKHITRAMAQLAMALDEAEAPPADRAPAEAMS